MHNVICPFCGKKHKISQPVDKFVGKKTKCKKCEESFVIEINYLEKDKEPQIELKQEEKKPQIEKKSILRTKSENVKKSFWHGIKDYFAFRDMIFLSWVKAFFFISYLIAILTTVGILTAQLSAEEINWIFLGSSLLSTWVAVLWLRIMCEFGIVFFRIHEELVSMNDKEFVTMRE